MLSDLTHDAAWWRQAVVYQVYPRSFADSNGDGLGDIAGITSRADYLKDLGIDAVWLSPFYPSALADGGYDVADYLRVAPRYGSNADLAELIAAAAIWTMFGLAVGGVVLSNAFRNAAESSFDDLLSEALRARDWIAAADASAAGEAGLRKADAIYRKALGIAPGDTLADVESIRFADQTISLTNLPRSAGPAFGQSEGFLFDAVYYLLAHPELVASVGLAGAPQNYFGSGAAAGRTPNSWFEADYYRNKWADLSALNLDDATLFRHYNLFGVWEGRSGGPAFDHFDGNRYLVDNPDVAAYIDGHLPDFLNSRANGAIAHYILYGAAEGRGAVDLGGQAIRLDYALDLIG